jgi:hypothetical protein
MSKDNAHSKKGIYAPGELGRLRKNLGVTDNDEAKRMAQLLGGEVGTERSLEDNSLKNSKNTLVGGKGNKRIRRVDVASEDDNNGKFKLKKSGPYPGDDPSVPARLSYSERVKIDQFSGQLVFEIKTSMQVLTSIFSFFKEPVDYVNPRFVTSRMNEYFNKIERLVNAARSLFPINNKKRNNQLKRASPFVYAVLDTIRSWDIETLSKNIAGLQAHPRTVKITDFAEVMRGIYRPMFIIEELSLENIKSAFKLIYKVLYIESPMEAKEKYQDVIRNIIASIVDIRRNVLFGLYPVVMKMISDRFIIYERFFTERRRRFMAFLSITETEQLSAADLSPQQLENVDTEALQNSLKDDETDTNNEENPDENAAHGENEEEDPNDPKVIERKAREEQARAEQKALEQGRSAMNVLFPKAGWDKLEEYPDLYPYFADIYSMRHGYELLAPSDPVQQVSVLLHILDDLFIGLRHANFGTIKGPDGNEIKLYDELAEILNNWRRYIEDSFSRDYLPRLTEYCRILENSRDSRSSYARKNLNELHWIKRLYFLPYYKFESIGPPPFPKNDIVPIYSEIRKLRKFLTVIAVGIEQGMRAGGAAVKAPCIGINNPWGPYNFQVPNPISKRMDMMLPPDKRINATLVFFSLSAVSLLDYIINNENSWAYGSRPGPLFRSVNNEGIIPLFGIDEKLDADKIFKESLKRSNA